MTIRLFIVALFASSAAMAQPQDAGGYEDYTDDYGGYEQSVDDSYSDTYEPDMNGAADQVEYEKSDTGNSLLDMFSDKSKRQKERVAERTDNRVDNEADSYFDRKVDEFMNGIFGN